MTDKKITDEEIIKRLERCVKRGNRNYDTDIVLDLINRQKSEIERLKGWQDVLKAEKHSLIKYTAYKEFAKFLIDKASKGLIHVSDLPDFVKEMVGEE